MKKDIKKLVEELEEEIGEEQGIVIDLEVDEITKPEGQTIHWEFPVTSKDDVVLAMSPLKNRIDEPAFVLALITAKGTDIVFMEHTAVELWRREIEREISGKHIYSGGTDLQIFTAQLVPLQSGDVTTMEELSARAFEGVSKSMVMQRSPHHGHRTNAQRFLDHLFGMYFVYLRVKHDTKNINLGKFKVPIKI